MFLIKESLVINQFNFNCFKEALGNRYPMHMAALMWSLIMTFFSRQQPFRSLMNCARKAYNCEMEFTGDFLQISFHNGHPCLRLTLPSIKAGSLELSLMLSEHKKRCNETVFRCTFLKNPAKAGINYFRR